MVLQAIALCYMQVKVQLLLPRVAVVLNLVYPHGEENSCIQHLFNADCVQKFHLDLKMSDSCLWFFLYAN
jgi:hypothetical protein